MPPIETIAPSDLTGDLFQAKTYLVTICEKFLEKSLQRFGSDNNDRRARHVKMMDLAFSFRTCQINLSAPGYITSNWLFKSLPNLVFQILGVLNDLNVQQQSGLPGIRVEVIFHGMLIILWTC